MNLRGYHIVALFLAYFGIFVNSSAQFRITPNLGQWDEQVKFKADIRSCKLFVSEAELTYLFYDAAKLSEAQHESQFDSALDVHVLKVKFLNANPGATYNGQLPYSDYNNYYKGNQSQKWKSKVYSYRKLYISEIYKNIDFELFEDKAGLKYNFIVKPGGDVQDIQLAYSGQDSLYISEGILKVKTRFGFISEQQPLVFENTDNGEKVIASSYQLQNNILSFNLGKKRSSNNVIVIDPVLVFSTYSGSQADNFGYTATFDHNGRGIAGGTVFDFGFPTTTGAYQIAFAGGFEENRQIGYVERDCGITVYEKDGKTLLYSTYLGGAFNNDQPHSMIVDSLNNLLVMGTTKSSDFPIGISPSFDATFNGRSDIFVVKFTSDGTDIIAGTFVGGSGFDGLNGDRASGAISNLLYNYADDFRGEIIVDTNDVVYVATTTTSSNFPIVSGFDNTFGGGQDACLFQLSADLSTLIFSTYLGGSGDDAAYGIDLGTHSDLYITGGTTSTSFGYSVPGMSSSTNGGRADGFIARLDLNTLNLMANTFIGTGAYDQSYFVKVDKYGKPFIFGQSEGQHNMSPNVYGIPNARMFLKKFNFMLTTVELETTFGRSAKTKPDISPTAFMIDECERIFIAGWGGIDLGGFNGGGTSGMAVTNNAFQKTTDGDDFYLAVFSKSFSELQYATYIGGKSTFSVAAHEHVDGGTSRFDKKGVVYQSVCAGCGGQSLFPTTPGVWSNTNNSDNCNNALFKFDFENLNRKPSAKDSMFVLLANDTLDFTIEVSDQDLTDSLRIVLDGDFMYDKNFPHPVPFVKSITRVPGKNAIKANIVFYPNCLHAGLDTIRLKVKVYDQGCPTQDSNQAIIKIVVKDPPLTVTPETFCLNFNEDGSVKLSWKAFTKNRFFGYVLLNRINPNGSIKVLDTLFDSNAGEFKDKPGFDARDINLAYFMVGYNICGKPYDAGIRINTTKEFNTPIDSTYLTYATVFENKAVQVNWFPSKEEDFESYDVYRADNINGVSVGYRKIKTIYGLNDTSFNDYNVNVAAKSYCYKIGINDKCGHISVPSNDACNIVLTGKVGHLYFDLDWMPYREWVGGVNNYELIRRVDTGILRSLVNTNLMRTYRDDDLDLWWGAYYYAVRAHEGLNDSMQGYNAQSYSNEIRLIQPPMVFVPNAFSPNDDYTNDVWGVSHAFVKEFRMQVYNRWGEKVWDNDFKGNQWDGSTRGKGAKNDVFVWIVTYKGWDGKFYTQKGTVTVMP